MGISSRHLQFRRRLPCVLSAYREIAAPCSARLAMTSSGACCIRRDAGTNLQVPPSRVMARREAPLALPLGELSPKVTERALQALPISTGHCSNDTHLRLVIPRSEATWESREGSCDFADGFPVIQPCPARLHPKGTSSRCALRAPRRPLASSQ